MKRGQIMRLIRTDMSLLENQLSELFSVYPILKIIDEENNHIISRNIIFKDLFRDEYIKNDENSCQGFLFVVSGNIKIYRLNEEGNETNLYNIGKGEFCHQAFSCFFSASHLNILAKAIQDSYLAIIPTEIFKRYLLENNRFIMSVYMDLYSKFSGIIEKKEEMIHETLNNRLIKLLMSKDSQIIYGTHSEIAFELDTVREVVSRKLKKFEKMGFIKISRGKIEILKDLDGLME